MTLLQALEWRYATKKFDAGKRLSPASVDALLQAANLAPSSFGLQPYRIVNVASGTLREQLAATTRNPDQVNSASHLLVFAATSAVGGKDVTAFLDRVAQVRQVERASLAARETQIAGAVGKLEGPAGLAWAQRQAYIALGVLVAAAAAAGIDACPMEGFDARAVDRILGLEAQGYRASAFVLLGHRAGDDPAAAQAKVRKPLEELVVTV
jgi:nitroreductase